MKFLKQIESTLATGTSPLSVASTTLNTNLNADLIDGYHLSDLDSRYASSNDPLIYGNINLNNNISFKSNAIIESNYDWLILQSSSGGDIYVGGDSYSSNVYLGDMNSLGFTQIYGQNISINADTYLYGNIKMQSGLKMLLGTTASTASEVLDVRGNIATDGQIKLSIANGTAPMTVVSQTLVTNFNADLLDGQHGSYYAPISSPTLTGTTTMSVGKATSAFIVPVGLDKYGT